MVTTAELNRRGLRYAVVVDGAATPASLQALDRQGLPYLVEVADGATMASRRALEARGLRYLVPVLVDATPASKASLAAQGLRYAVQVDADILPADRLVLQRQGLACYVEVDSSGNSVSAAAVGGGALLVGETNGFATDFLHPVDAERVAKKTAGAVVSSGLSFFTQSGTSSKWVYNITGVLASVAAGSLAIDYDPVTHVPRGLLVEPAATNLMLRSSEFDSGAIWGVSGTTVAANNTAAPDGTTTADKIQETSATAFHYVFQAVTSASGAYTFSIYLKAAERTWAWLRFTTAPVNDAFFNLSNGTIGTADSGYSPTITAVGNGWYRCSITVTAVAGTYYGVFGPATADNVGNYAGTAGSGIYACASQAEAGTVATSPIPTLAASVTRAADNISFTPASINYSATAGSWWVDATPMALTGYPIIGFANGSASPSKVASSTTLVMFDGTNTQKTVANSLAAHKTSAAYAAGDRSFTADGLVVQVDTGSTTNLLNPGTIGFGNTPGVGASTGMMYIRQVRYVPRRKTSLEQVTESVP